MLIIRDGKVLLVKDKGRHDYSLPGGGFKPNESTSQAAIREIGEELSLRVISATRLRRCDFHGGRAYHKVCLIAVEGTPRINRRELDGHIWWDMEQPVRVQGHVRRILHEHLKRNP